MDGRAESEATRRLQILVRIAFVWALCLFARLIYLQVVRHDDLTRQALLQQEHRVEVQAPRGAIFDRTGQPLAVSVPTDSVCINPLLAPDLAVAADLLSRVLDLDRVELLKKLRRAADNRRGFLWVKRRISREESEKLQSYKLEWVEFRKESERSYPKGSLAANLIGSVDHRGHGNAGVELAFDEDLRGKPGVVRMLTDVKRRGIDSIVAAEPEPGHSLALSIDERIQFVADRELGRAVVEDQCETGSIVVMDPRNGEILAMSNYPTFDPNEPPNSQGGLAARANLAVSVPFEPGSVFKVITLAAALETTRLQPTTVISCGRGSMNLYGRVIRDHKAYAALTMADVLAKSSNIGAINVGLQVGEQRLLDYVRRFGFGSATGIRLPGESSGLVRDLSQWSRTSIGSVAMGHEISSTTLQLALATSGIANGGLLPRPRLVLWRQKPGEEPEWEPRRPPRRVLRPETAITMRQMMERVVLSGTGTKARLAGYTTGGKTGSAQIFDLENRRYTHRYNASFAGFAPVASPAVVVVVTLNGASKFGGAVAAPVFREVAQVALRMLGTVRDLPSEIRPEEPKEEADLNDVAIADLSSSPPVLPGAGEADLPGQPLLVGPRVPDFQGKSLRLVLQESAAVGLPVEFSGSGIARAQYPPAGAVLPAGERIRIEFAH